MAAELFVTTTDRIVDPDLERVVYGAGDRVPLADAVKYGLVSEADGKKAAEVAKSLGEDWTAANVAQTPAPEPRAAATPSPAPAKKAATPATAAPAKKAPAAGSRARKGPAEDRAKKPASNR